MNRSIRPMTTTDLSERNLPLMEISGGSPGLKIKSALGNWNLAAALRQLGLPKVSSQVERDVSTKSW